MINARLEFAFLFASTLLAAGAYPALGQAASVVIGIVADTAHQPLSGVEVLAMRAHRRTASDSRGFFLMGLPAGEELFLIRQVGYLPQTFTASLVGSDTLRIGVMVARAAVTLPDLAVKAEGVEYRGKLAGFAERLLTSGAPRSAFLTRKDIEGQNSNRLYDLLLKAGMKVRYDSKGRETVTCPRGRSSFRAPKTAFYLDGVRVPDDQDVTYLGAIQLEAIEVYGSTATRPPQYNATGSDGVVLLWLRDDAR